jgi:hypothetical protein
MPPNFNAKLKERGDVENSTDTLYIKHREPANDTPT